MVFKKKVLFDLLLIFVLLSCSKDDVNTGKIIPKPAGKYLSEIKCYKYPMTPIKDTLKVANFEYDENRYLKKIKYYEFATQEVRRIVEFYYNNNGQLYQIMIQDTLSPVSYQLNYSYSHNYLGSIDVYCFESGLKTIVQKYSLTKDEQNNVLITKNFYSVSTGKPEGLQENEKYYFNSTGNLYKAHFLIGTKTYLERIEEYEYDKMKNPFANLEIPYFDLGIPFIIPCEYMAINNVLRRTTTHVALADKISHDTVTYKYEDNLPIDVNGKVFYKYIKLK